MLDKITIYLIILINIGVLYQFIRTLPKANRFLCIVLVPLVFYFLNYPLRAFILINSSDFEYSYEQILLALVYATIFMIVLLISYKRSASAGIYTYNHENIKVNDKDKFICHVTFVITVTVFNYRMITGEMFGLYEDESALYDSFSGNFIKMFDSVKWFCIAASAIIYSINKQKIYLIELLVTASIIVFGAVASTSKGAIVALLLFYLFMKSIHKTRINYFGLFITSIAIYFYMKITYLIRYYGVVRGEFTLEQMISNYSDLMQFYYANEFTSTTTNSITNRFNYLDGLILTIQKLDIFNYGLYSLGSFSELLNIIPRFIWNDRPLINFNIYLTQHIWGNEGIISETPVGRIGESFLVLGGAGIIYALFYGKLFSLIENKVIENSSVSYFSMYFVVLYYYVWSDSHLVFYWKTLLFVTVIVFTIYYLYASIQNKDNKLIATDEN